ncbi:glycosyl hydrolase [Halomontanus rarus]|uniref:glycosyl hydrolase n=1 Tax=Halomontanus rarus TaxID=3034020 RepID=UPI001A98B184
MATEHDREPSTLRAGFRSPPATEYGNVPFWWWDGDELSEDRITEQLETLQEKGVEAVCFEQKYPHGSPEGPQAPYFSEEWWEYMAHTVAECDRLGMSLWIHDLTYHHSPPQWKRYWQNHVEGEIDDHPEFQGHVLDRVSADIEAGETAELEFPESFTPLSIAAYPVTDAGDEADPTGDDRLDLENEIDLEAESGYECGEEVEAGGFEWTAPNGEAGIEAETYHVAAVGYRPEGLCRTTRDVVDRILELHYGEYVERFGDDLGDPIVGTFQDELYVMQGTIPCDERVVDRYRAEWGEDLESKLIALFEDCGPETRAVRARYYDVIVTVLEENWFRPLHEWHERRGLRFAHDNWGRNDLTEHATEYGDYMRTMRWFQEPGYDDGGAFEGIGTRNFFDGKLASSIAACYDRDRVWGELLHTTGWGFPLDLHFAAIAENACYGLDHYNKHGLYYATLGGWYEHAPPDTHFRQPYWEQMEAFNDAVTRLMYLCAQGETVVDLAMLYPITSVQAHRLAGGDIEVDGPGGHHQPELEDEATEIDERTREIAEDLYTDVSDLLFVDRETLRDGHVANGRLAVAGRTADVFVLGPVSTVRRDVLETAAALVDEGGTVLSIGRLPTATVEDGADDERLEELLERIFGDGLERWRSGSESGSRSNTDDDPVVAERADGGVAILADEVDGLASVLDRYADRDVHAPEDVYYIHQRVDDQDIYLLLNTRDEARTLEVDLRATGRPERWDVQAGTVEPIHAFARRDGYTTLELEFAPHEFHVIGFDGESGVGASVTGTSLGAIDGLETDDGIRVSGYAAESGTHEATVDAGSEVRTAESEFVDVPAPVALEDGWTFELEPTLDNRWGDVRYPASEGSIGAEVKEFEHRSEHAGPGERTDGLEEGWHESAADSESGDGWEPTRISYGPYFWSRTGEADPDAVATPPESVDGWEPYEFSTEIGTPGTHPDDHGFNGVLSDDFLVAEDEPTHFWTTVSGTGERVACHYGAGIDALLIDGERVPLEADEPGTFEVDLPAGPTSEQVQVQVVVEPEAQTHVVFEPLPATARERDMSYVPRLRWFHEESEGEGVREDEAEPALAFDAFPWLSERVDWFRFEAPVGATGFSLPLPVAGDLRVWIDGEERDASDGRVDLEAPLEEPATVIVRSEAAGAPGGARWDGPAEFETAPVEVATRDWCDLGLQEYSGIGVYRRTLEVPDLDLDAGDRLVLDLGDVGVSAAVLADGERVGTVFAAPYEVDLTDAATDADGEPLDELDLEVRVANTIANHFAAETPTRYVYEGQRRSGLFGPVELRTERGVTIALED